MHQQKYCHPNLTILTIPLALLSFVIMCWIHNSFVYVYETHAHTPDIDLTVSTSSTVMSAWHPGNVNEVAWMSCRCHWWWVVDSESSSVSTSQEHSSDYILQWNNTPHPFYFFWGGGMMEKCTYNSECLWCFSHRRAKKKVSTLYGKQWWAHGIVRNCNKARDELCWMFILDSFSTLN